MKTNRVAAVTGAGGTLCSEMARALAKQGIAVALLGRTEEKLLRVHEDIKSQGGVSLVVPTDVVSREGVSAACARITRDLGPCSILINGAGGNQNPAVTSTNVFSESELQDGTSERGFFNLDMNLFQEVILANTMGTVLPSFVFGREMAKARKGCIINIASMNSFRPLSRVAAYGMAKAGIANFTQWLAAYLAPANIRVNAIAPGFFLNDRSRKILLTDDGGVTDRGASVMSHTPMKRFGEAHELVGCMNWLVNDEASGFVTGIVIPVDGGFLASAGV